MAYTRTTLSAAVAVTDTSIVIASATSVAIGNRLIIDQEEMTVTKGYVSASTTVPVSRGQNGTITAAHASGAGVAQGIGAADWPDPSGQQQLVSPPREVALERSIDVTATGATGSTAAALPAVTPCIVVATGVSGAGINIPTGAAMPGARYLIKNATTGALSIYAVGSTINGTTGTTAFALTATGNLGVNIVCVEAGIWQAFGNT